MYAILTVDCGNSSVKGALWDAEGQVVDSVSAPYHACHLLERLMLQPSGEIIAMMCAVHDPGPQLMRLLQRHCIRIDTLGPDTPLPIAVRYDRRQLGADRLAAAVGAAWYHPGTEMVVADFGTAATYDHMSAQGVYTGGNIAPGLRMRLQALHSYTERLPWVQPAPELHNSWGANTAQAMRNGALLGLVAELGYYAQLLGPDSLAVITGGDAPAVARLSTARCRYYPHLVHAGLYHIITTQLSHINHNQR